jgi:branched-chain amino acid transport system substrate-binding protein
MAKFSSENLKLKKAAILRDVGNDYSVGLADFFAAKFKEMGGTIVADESFKAGDQDFKAQLTTIKNRKPDLIYIPAYYTDVALAGRQARELGLKQPLAGGDGWDSSKLYEIAQGSLDGSYFSNHYTHESPEPRVQEFVKKYKEAYGETPDALAALGYDAALVAIDAMKKAPDLTGPKLAEALANTKSFPGVAGTITIDQDHNAVKSAVVIGIEKNAPKYVATVNP